MRGYAVVGVVHTGGAATNHREIFVTKLVGGLLRGALFGRGAVRRGFRKTQAVNHTRDASGQFIPFFIDALRYLPVPLLVVDQRRGRRGRQPDDDSQPQRKPHPLNTHCRRASDVIRFSLSDFVVDIRGTIELRLRDGSLARRERRHVGGTMRWIERAALDRGGLMIDRHLGTCRLPPRSNDAHNHHPG